jgi:gliding motility-associated-like protein
MRGIALFICLLLLGMIPAQAQTCTGSLGDPIINIDFGAGANKYGPQIATTNYSYVVATPVDGSYTIANTTSGMYSTWYVKTDHTGNAGGYMMVVNASTAPGEFYRQTISTLCPNTTYEFAAWILNLLIPDNNKPNVTFTISTPAGVPIQSYSTGDIANGNPNWIKYGMTFTTLAGGGDVVLTITNNGPGGNGNDLALDDITFRPCGPSISSTFPALGLNTQTTKGCTGTGAQSYTMHADAPVGYTQYLWEMNDGTGWVTATGVGANTTTFTKTFPANVTPGTYQFRMATALGANFATTTCRVYSQTLTVIITAPPPPPPNTSIAVCEGDILTLNPGVSSSTTDTYSWTKTGGTPFSSNLTNPVLPDAKVGYSGIYNAVITSSTGCTTTAAITVTVNPKIVASAGNNATICQGDQTQLQATVATGAKYAWLPTTGLNNPAIANPVAQPTVTTIYTVTITSAANCVSTAQVTVTVLEPPVITAGTDQIMTEGQSIKLKGTVSPGATYFWTPTTYLSDPTSLTPTATPIDDITYTLHAMGGAPCNFTRTDDVFIRVYKKVVIPNTFTPNGDGINDTWDITALITYPESLTQIFNRNGSLVYQSQGYTTAWDGRYNGKPLPEGVYYYKIDLKNGTIFSGPITVIR